MEVKVYGRVSSSPSYGGWPSTDERSSNDSIDRWHSEPSSSTLAASSSLSSVVTSTCYSSDAESHEGHDRSPCPNIEEIPSFSYLSPDFRSLVRNKTRKPTRASNNLPDGLKGALNSYLEWHLPPNYKDVVSRSVSPVECRSAKELYLRLSKPVLVDDGELSIAIDMRTGRRSLMLSASKLMGNMATNDHSWKWIPREAEESYWNKTLVPDSRFPKVAELLGGFNLEINAEVNTSELSPKTCVYAAFFVFALSYPIGFHGRFQEASITVGGHTTRHTVCLWPAREGRFFLEQNLVKMPQTRSDGWKEVEMGEFISRDVGDGDDDRSLVRISLNGLEKNFKAGLIIQGIEVRPKSVKTRYIFVGKDVVESLEDWAI